MSRNPVSPFDRIPHPPDLIIFKTHASGRLPHRIRYHDNRIRCLDICSDIGPGCDISWLVRSICFDNLYVVKKPHKKSFLFASMDTNLGSLLHPVPPELKKGGSCTGESLPTALQNGSVACRSAVSVSMKVCYLTSQSCEKRGTFMK